MASAKVGVSITAARSPQLDEVVDVLVQVSPADERTRLPCDICIVVDTSGSMQTPAKIRNTEELEAEGSVVNLSVLDIVRHALKTVVDVLQPGDRLGIVAFSDKALMILPLTAMSTSGQQSAVAAVDKLVADGQTNQWAGLHMGMEMLREGRRQGASAALILLTDGVPNVTPEGGDLQALKRYREKVGGKLPCVVNAFGFGSDLDSALLHNLACEGEGLYSFIPDAGFVGTALVCCLANTLVTMGRHATITVELADPRCALPDKSGAGNESARTLNLGALQFGQTRAAIVRVKAPADFAGPFVRARLDYESASGPLSVVADGSQTVALDSNAETREVLVQSLRLEFVELLQSAVSEPDIAKSAAAVRRFGKKLGDALVGAAAKDNRLSALKEDVDGQVTEALMRQDWYKEWGAHYLRSLGRAHSTQQCNNFKDPGVQVYGGTLYHETQDLADDKFMSLPPPQVIDRGNIEMLMAMGYPEDGVKRALAAADDDVEIAMHYMLEGIPTGPVPEYLRPRRWDVGAPRVAARAPTAIPGEHGRSAPAPAISMGMYHNPNAACFSGASSVALADGSTKPLRLLRRGDHVATLDGGSSAVVCMVETCTGGRAKLVKLSEGAEATPWHPVLLGGRWTFPQDVAAARWKACGSVFNFVLERGHTARIGGLWTVSLGHNQKGETVEHPYWGTDLVIADLAAMPGWAEGKVELAAGCVRRDDRGIACGLIA